MGNYKDAFNHMEIPKELNQMVNQTINKHKSKVIFKRTILSFAASLCILASGLNMSETFAETVTNLPIIGGIAKIMIVRDYDFEKENLSGSVTVPNVDIESEDLETQINDMINEQIDIVLREAEERVSEYKEAYLETGGTEEGWADKNMNVTADYEIFLQDDSYLSFRVYTHESLAAVYATNLYFTIDLNNQALITLPDLIGSDYQAIITEQSLEMIAENPDQYFEQEANWQARDNMSFYLNENQDLVVVFEKYEIAPGAMGRIEMIIQ